MNDVLLQENPALAELYAKARELHSYGFWTVLKELEPSEVNAREKPCVWRLADFRPHLDTAAKLIPIEKAERRAFIMHNPAYDMSKPFTTNTLFAAFQIINPGEVAGAHRHSPSASRMVLTGNGGYTTVEGEKCYLERGDLIITPNYTWHDHGNEGTDSLIWCDILDIPIPHFLNAYFFEWGYKENGVTPNKAMQTPTKSRGYSTTMYGTGGIRPAFVEHDIAKGYGSPQVHFPYSKVREALQAMRTEEGSPYDGIIVDYVDPRNGGPLSRTLDYQMQLLRPGEQTQKHRHTYGQVFVCLEGEGYTEIDGERYDWGASDAFCLPTFRWHRHVNISTTTDAVLYSVSDRAAMRALGLLWEDQPLDDGTFVRIEG